MSRGDTKYKRTLAAPLICFPGRKHPNRGPWYNLGLPRGQAERESEPAFLSDPERYGTKNREVPASSCVTIRVADTLSGKLFKGGYQCQGKSNSVLRGYRENHISQGMNGQTSGALLC